MILKKSKKKIAIAYENYYCDKSKEVAIKGSSFTVYKKEVEILKKIREFSGFLKKTVQQEVINILIKKEIDYSLALDYSVSVSEKELNDYIKNQLKMAKSDKTTYLYYLKNISIEELYECEKDSIKKELAVEKYFSLLENKYGANESKKEYRKAFEKAKAKENIKVLI